MSNQFLQLVSAGLSPARLQIHIIKLKGKLYSTDAQEKLEKKSVQHSQRPFQLGTSGATPSEDFRQLKEEGATTQRSTEEEAVAAFIATNRLPGAIIIKSSLWYSVTLSVNVVNPQTTRDLL